MAGKFTVMLSLKKNEGKWKMQDIVSPLSTVITLFLEVE